jgi:hypothetical protein
MPLAPRLHSTRGGSARRPERLDVAHRHRGGDEQRRLSPAAARPARRHRRLAESSPCAEHPADRLRGALVGAAPARQPVLIRARRGSARASASSCSAAAGSSASESLSTDAGSCQAPSGSSATCRIRRRGPASQLAQRLGDRQVADPQDEVGRHRRGERLVAQQRVVVRDRGIPAARARQRIGQQRPARGLAERAAAAPSSGSWRSWRPATSTPRRAAATSSSRRSGAATWAASAACPRRARCARACARRTYGRRHRCGRVVLGQRLVAHQRLAQREVQVHDARAGPRAPSSRRGRRACASSAAALGSPRGCRPRRTTWPRRRTASAGRSPARRRSRAAPAGGRR